MRLNKPKGRGWITLPFVLLVLLIINLLTGSYSAPVSAIVHALGGQELSVSENSSMTIFIDLVTNIRIPKAISCILAGSALALSGLLMQTLFRNPLAGPGVLGLSSGASLAVSVVLMTNLGIVRSISGPWMLAMAASLGCLGVFMVVLIIAQRVRDNASLLIIGLMIGAGSSSLVSVIQYSSRAEELQAYMMWTFGSVGGLGWNKILVLGLLLACGLILCLTQVKALNAWMLGDNYAQSLGINIKKSRLLVILAASILTGGVTAFCGPIAFVGLAVPHLTKLVIKSSNHKVLIPQVAMAGGGLILLCDVLSQLPGDRLLPLNAVTALFGAPVVIWIVMRSKRISV